MTPRELEVLIGLAKGESAKETAARLLIGYRSVETYRENLYEKTHCMGSMGAALYAIRNRHVEVFNPFPGTNPQAVLDEFQLKILVLLGEGRTVKEVAAELLMTERNVESRKETILRRLRVNATNAPSDDYNGNTIVGIIHYCLATGLTKIDQGEPNGKSVPA